MLFLTINYKYVVKQYCNVQKEQRINTFSH